MISRYDSEGNLCSGCFRLNDGWTAATATLKGVGDPSPVKSVHDFTFHNREKGIRIKVKGVRLKDIPKQGISARSTLQKMLNGLIQNFEKKHGKMCETQGEFYLDLEKRCWKQQLSTSTIKKKR